MSDVEVVAVAPVGGGEIRLPQLEHREVGRQVLQHTDGMNDPTGGEVDVDLVERRAVHDVPVGDDEQAVPLGAAHDDAGAGLLDQFSARVVAALDMDDGRRHLGGDLRQVPAGFTQPGGAVGGGRLGAAAIGTTDEIPLLCGDGRGQKSQTGDREKSRSKHWGNVPRLSRG